jgi:hypothetical protein
MDINTPKDLLRMYYYIIQAHTTLRPGPKFRAILKKAGIQELDPPTKNVLMKRIEDMRSSELSRSNTTLYEKNRPFLLAQSGGSWYDTVYAAVDRFRLRNRNALHLFLTSMTIPLIFFLAIKASNNQRGQRDQELREALVILEGMMLVLTGGVVTIVTLSGMFLDFLEGGGAIEQAQQIAAEELNDDPNRFSILDIPPSGKLQMKQRNNTGEAIIDPITFTEFQAGDKVAVIKENRKAIILVNSLQAWIANPLREGPPKHPLTNEPFTKANVKVYTIEFTDMNLPSGGRYQKSKSSKAKKSKAKKSKTSTRKDFHK